MSSHSPLRGWCKSAKLICKKSGGLELLLRVFSVLFVKDLCLSSLVKISWYQDSIPVVEESFPPQPHVIVRYLTP